MGEPVVTNWRRGFSRLVLPIWIVGSVLTAAKHDKLFSPFTRVCATDEAIGFDECISDPGSPEGLFPIVEPTVDNTRPIQRAETRRYSRELDDLVAEEMGLAVVVWGTLYGVVCIIAEFRRGAV